MIGFLAGCQAHTGMGNPSPSAATPASVGPDSRQATTTGGRYRVVYQPIPDPIPFNELFELDVRVWAGASGQHPAEGVAIAASADMPAHGHGMNLVPRARRIGPGHFRVSGMLFHMPGPWVIFIDIRPSDRAGAGDSGVVERAQFEVVLP